MSMDEALQVFIEESRELLREMESALLACQREAGDADTINCIFRAAHTIKGSSGLFGLDDIVSFVHVVETALDRVRGGSVALDGDLVALLLECTDHIELLVASVAAGPEGSSASLAARSAQLSASLQAKAGAVNGMRGANPHGPAATAGAPAAPCSSEPAAATGCWHICVRFKPNVLKDGMDPLSIIRYLSTLGTITGLQIADDALPAAELLDPQCCYLGFEIALRSDAGRDAIESAFEFVREDCTLHLLPPQSPLRDYAAVIRGQSEPAERLGELLVKCGTLTAAELSAALALSMPANGGAAAQPRTAAVKKEAKAAENRSIRVDASKLDELITLVGELIIAAAGADLGARRAHNVELQESTSRLSDLVQEVRDRALQLRMVRIAATFNRFHRIVSDVARETGKEIELQVTGEDTELDKTVVERIADPLTHLVRNAVDHGIEAAAVRASRGKPARGTVKLNAYHDSGSVVIEVSDDGGGLKREAILAKAVERGLVEPGRALSDSEIYALIFEPGFSTAPQVTNLSGRGVGMDVVKRNIAALRGSVGIESVEGAGTKVSVRLPLTLAIINGFLIGLGKSVFVVPLDMVDECVEFCADQPHDYTDLRGQPLPFIRLREYLGIEGTSARRENVVVVNYAGQKAGLVVDALLGEFQTVIKPLNRMFNAVRCVSGSTILGNGEVALILDVPALMQNVVGAAAAAARPAGAAVM